MKINERSRLDNQSLNLKHEDKILKKIQIIFFSLIIIGVVIVLMLSMVGINFIILIIAISILFIYNISDYSIRKYNLKSRLMNDENKFS